MEHLSRGAEVKEVKFRGHAKAGKAERALLRAEEGSTRAKDT